MEGRDECFSCSHPLDGVGAAPLTGMFEPGEGVSAGAVWSW